MDAQGLWNQDYLRFRGNKCGKENLHLYGSFPPPFGLNTVNHGPLLPLKKAKSMG